MHVLISVACRMLVTINNSCEKAVTFPGGMESSEVARDRAIEDENGRMKRSPASSGRLQAVLICYNPFYGSRFRDSRPSVQTTSPSARPYAGRTRAAPRHDAELYRGCRAWRQRNPLEHRPRNRASAELEPMLVPRERLPAVEAVLHLSPEDDVPPLTGEGW